MENLLFINDSLLFYQATVQECHQLLHILAQYEFASGQAINRQKTSLFFSKNTKPKVKEAIQAMLEARIMNDCEKYLGLHMVEGKPKANNFRESQEQISIRVLGWKENSFPRLVRKFLSKR